MTIVLFAFLCAVSAPKREICNDRADSISHGENPYPVVEQKRDSITFIMGNSENGFYANAAYYYRHNKTDRTEYVETSLRTLIEVRDYLKNNPPAGGKKWGVINIVVHGNEWTGLGIPVFPGGERATRESLAAAVESGAFCPPDQGVVDSKTEIRIHGCALGRDHTLLKLISRAFGGNEEYLQVPVVRSCRYFISYETTENNGEITHCHEYLTDFWYAFYRAGCRPGDIRLADQLRHRYPDADINWRDALKRTLPRYVGDNFHLTFNLPFKWTVIYPDAKSRPDIREKKYGQKWLNSQIEFRQYVDSLNIPADYFEWTIQKVRYKCDDGTFKPAIEAIGRCTILCVLKTLTEPESNRIPLRPLITDTKYYGSSGRN